MSELQEEFEAQASGQGVPVEKIIDECVKMWLEAYLAPDLEESRLRAFGALTIMQFLTKEQCQEVVKNVEYRRLGL